MSEKELLFKIAALEQRIKMFESVDYIKALIDAKSQDAKDWRTQVRIIYETVIKNWPCWSNEDRRFLALALAGEVGEVLNLIKKSWRGDVPGTSWSYAALQEELGDVRIYLELLAMAFDVDLDETCERLIKNKLLPRWPEAREAIEGKPQDAEEVKS